MPVTHEPWPMRRAASDLQRSYGRGQLDAALLFNRCRGRGGRSRVLPVQEFPCAELGEFPPPLPPHPPRLSALEVSGFSTWQAALGRAWMTPVCLRSVAARGGRWKAGRQAGMNARMHA